MKILYILNSVRGNGGLQKITLDKANYMIEKFNWEIHILCGPLTNLNQNFELHPNITIHYFPKQKTTVLWSISRILFYKKILVTINPTIVSICNNDLEDFLWPIFTVRSIKIIKEVHGSYESIAYKLPSQKRLISKLYRRSRVLIYKLLIKQFSRLILLTQADRKKWNCSNAEVIHNFIADNSRKKQIEIPKQYFAIAVGNLFESKGCLELLKVWREVVKQNNCIKLKIFGDGPLRKRMQDTISEWELSENVFIMGFTKNIHEEYAKASILVSGSFSEGLPMTFIEAQYQGLPVVSYNSPNGPSEIITNRENGVLIAVGDFTHFAKVVIELYCNPCIVEEMSKKSFANSLNYQAEPIMDQWKNLFINL